jgi:hypothetical protein
MNGQEQLDWPVEQLWYTWSDKGLENLSAGFRIRAASPGLSAVGSPRVEALRPYLSYRSPADARPGELTIENAPRCLALIDGEGERLLLHKVYAGLDARGRGDNYFIHLLAGLPRTFSAEEAVALWRCDGRFWRTYDDPAQPATLPRLTLGALRRQLPKLYGRQPQLQLTSAERKMAERMLPRLIQAFLEQQDRLDKQRQAGGAAVEGPIPPIYLVALPDQVAYLVWALTRCLPPELLTRLTFTTYEYSYDIRDRAPRLSATTTALIATCPRPQAGLQEWEDILPNAFYHTGWTFNLYTERYAALQAWPEAEAFAREVTKALVDNRADELESLRQALRASDVSSLLWDYTHWQSNRGALSPEHIVRIVSERQAVGWYQPNVRTTLLQSLLDERMGEQWLAQILPDLEHTGRERRSNSRLDSALTLFEGLVLEQVRAMREQRRSAYRAAQLLSATARLLLALDALQASRSSLQEILEFLLSLVTASSEKTGPGAPQAPMGSWLRVVAIAGRVLDQPERYVEIIDRWLAAGQEWTGYLELLRQPLPPSWQLLLCGRLAGQLERQKVEMADWFRLGEQQWPPFAELLRATLQYSGGSDTALALTSSLLKSSYPRVFDLLEPWLNFSSNNAYAPISTILGLIDEHIQCMEQLTAQSGIADRQIRIYYELLNVQGRGYLNKGLPALRALCLRMFRLVWQWPHPQREELLINLLAVVSDEVGGELLAVAGPLGLSRGLAASLLRSYARDRGPLFYRQPAGRLLYDRAIREDLLSSEGKLQIIAVWLENLEQLQQSELEAVLHCAQLKPAERDALLEQYGLRALSAYPSSGLLFELTRSYLRARSIHGLLRSAEAQRFLYTLSRHCPPVPVYLANLARAWRAILEALAQGAETEKMSRALTLLERELSAEDYQHITRSIDEYLYGKERKKLEQWRRARRQSEPERNAPGSQGAGPGSSWLSRFKK